MKNGGNMENNELGINEIRALIFEIINAMEDEDMRQLLKYLENWQQSKSERRKHPRISTFISTDFSDDDRIYKDFIRNISAGGLYIETEIPFLVDKELRMTFILPDSEDPIKVTGKIVRIYPKGVGVKLYDTIPNIKSIQERWDFFI